MSDDQLPDPLADIRPVSRRKARLESQLRREIATVVTSELRDPRLGFLTITRCELSDDYEQVTAYYTLLGPRPERLLAAEALSRARPYVQRAYAKSIRLRRLPRLVFAYDEQEEQRQELHELIRKARASDPDHGEEPSSEP